MPEHGRVEELENDGLRFPVRDRGPLDGEVVVLLHGFPQRASSWSTVEPLLHAAGLRTLAPEQRGYAPGARPTRRRDYRLPRLAGDVLALLRRTGPAHLVGHDWGAAVAWWVAGEHPEQVRTLTSVSVPHPAAMVASLTSSDQLLRSWYMLFFQLPWLPERLLASRLGERMLARIGMDAGMVADFRRDVVATGALPGGLAWYRALPFTGPAGVRSPVRVPTTHVWSDGDAALARRGADLTAEHVDADYRLEVLRGVSHWIPEQAPERLAEIVLARARQD